LFCDGSAVSRTTYAALFAKIGTQHGAGDGATTFNVPDYRGMFLRGFDAGRGVDTGRAFASFQDDEIESHGHGVTINDPGHIHTLPGNTIRPGPGIGGGSTQEYAGGATNAATTGITASANNTGGAETRPKNVAVYICIKT
jgi:microcystin-dependent protein